MKIKQNSFDNFLLIFASIITFGFAYVIKAIIAEAIRSAIKDDDK